MWLYILFCFSREQSHSNTCKQRGPRVASYFSLDPLLSGGFHNHILLPLCIPLSFCVSLFFFPHSFPISLWKPIVKTWSFPPQCQCKRAPFAVMAPSFGKCERWVAPNGKHTVSPESVFEGLPRSWVLTNRLKGYCVELRFESSVDWMCDLKKKKNLN